MVCYMADNRKRVTRRRVIRTLGASGLTALAGCSSGQDGGEGTRTSTSRSGGGTPTRSETESGTTESKTETETETKTETETETLEEMQKPASHESVKKMATDWAVKNTELPYVEFSAWRPKEADMKDIGMPPSELPTDYNPNNIPLAFRQRLTNTESIHVNQLPNGTSGKTVTNTFAESSDFSRVGTINGFDIFDKDGDMQAIGAQHHIQLISSYTNKQSFLRTALKTAFRQYGDAGVLDSETKLAADALNPVQDSFAVLDDLERLKEPMQLIEGLSENDFDHEILAGLSTVNFTKKTYGAWTFKTERGARRAANFGNDVSNERGTYTSFSTNGRVLTAKGPGKDEFSSAYYVPGGFFKIWDY